LTLRTTFLVVVLTVVFVMGEVVSVVLVVLVNCAGGFVVEHVFHELLIFETCIVENVGIICGFGPDVAAFLFALKVEKVFVFRYRIDVYEHVLVV